jgi:hypothetical protein
MGCLSRAKFFPFVLVIYDYQHIRREFMIKVLAETNDRVLVVKASEKLTHVDYDAIFIPKLTQCIENNGSARVFMILGDDFKGWELEAAWDDAKFGMQHRNDFTRLAIMGEPEWVNWTIRVAANFISGEVQMFTDYQFTEALDWVSA